MNETTKLSAARIARGDYAKYLTGHGIDIGCGPDPLVVDGVTADIWDKAQGDAQAMAGATDESYDFVYSSHCLEHLRDPIEGLRNWLRIVKPGGYLYIVVPDYIRYEGCQWPSRKNRDHKASFSMELTRDNAGRANHYNIVHDLQPAIEAMGGEIVRAAVEDDGFDYNAGLVKDQTLGNAAAGINLVVEKQ